MKTLIAMIALVGAAAMAAAFVVVPLWRQRRLQRPSTAAADLIARRARLREMESEWQAGLIGDEEYREARIEAERELLGSTDEAHAADNPAGGNPGAGRWRAAFCGMMVVALAAGLYLSIGRPDFLVGTPSVQQPSNEEFNPTEMAERLPELENHVATRPGDIQAWGMLGRAYLALERPDEAAQAMGRAVEANGDIPDLLLIWARALAAEQQGRFSGKPTRLVERALVRAPAHPDALFFGGLAAAQAGDWERTRALWERLRAQLPDSDATAARIDEALDEIPDS
ncbi:c-type cytochrome biogenesis protein CcmI [Aquisalimonas lutea]|uniref:c-type cytochrome biogenesis protein CcmI n=1 Tax=Aquisalimonas lutea TaxID=1327750 RepID=UPI0025B49BDB|nr:c-type cytochrome biogenesis protein CcmI [Aquisalimonas lutea]MDN3519077.1 c-type cytochrome biogenesis protein CcmI [Aquisalimonas lutea]